MIITLSAHLAILLIFEMMPDLRKRQKTNNDFDQLAINSIVRVTVINDSKLNNV